MFINLFLSRTSPITTHSVYVTIVDARPFGGGGRVVSTGNSHPRSAPEISRAVRGTVNGPGFNTEHIHPGRS